MKPWLQKNAVEMYSKHKERKSAVAARFIRALTFRWCSDWIHQYISYNH